MMKRVKITVKRMARYEDLMAEYETPISHACDMRLGQTFVVENCEKPEGMCQSAWETMLPFVKELAEGGGNFFDGSYTNKYGKPILYRGAIALETQRYPDAPNQPSFPSVVLEPMKTYKHHCIYRFYAK